MGNSSTTTATTPILGRITLAQLVRSEEFQVRSRLCTKTVNRYASAIKAGADMPPLQVALVDGVHILVDGFHRAAAYEALGYDEVDVSVIEATRDNALWMAAEANTRHGLPLTGKEHREVFRVYIRTGQHLKGKRRKSYREMQDDLKKPHTTLRNWTEQDFPGLFRAMGGDNRSADGGLPDRPAPPPAGAQGPLKALEDVRQAYQQTTCPEARQAIRERFQEYALAIVGEGWQETQSDF
ncbi:ParB/RepB/Spo0J family partition protein [Aquipseudomonas alcaligenes]|uniref:ParB/RepB/Spo0J family partition protein n=1 Tax=Aquipseudomonas alcaligenes TaxID=43263 RepID=UPI0037483A19